MFYAQDAEVPGANEVAVSHDAEAMAAHAKSLDPINTVASPYELDVFMSLLKRDGPGGRAATPHPLPVTFNLVGKRRAVAGSMIGGITETPGMLAS
jgi:uncharacterized zinc-type alcohol dehydrogenase-like protein